MKATNLLDTKYYDAEVAVACTAALVNMLGHMTNVTCPAASQSNLVKNCRTTHSGRHITTQLSYETKA